MELFDKRFVHFMWDDELEGKTGHVSNDIKCLCDYVNNNPSATELIEHSSDESQPFEIPDGIRFRFAYYDPNYEVKKAFNEGKEIQYRVKGFVDWEDYTNQNPCWDDEDREWRVKPEEEKEETKDKDKMNPIQEKKMRRYYLNLGNWGELKKIAVKMFKGIAALNERFAEKISKGGFVTQDDWKMMNDLWRTFNYTNDDKKICKEDLHHLFTDDLDEEFVEIEVEEAEEKKDKKLECPCEDGIDSKACVGCEHSEDGKPHTFENYHCYICDKPDEEKRYRPYESSAEMIMDFIDRFKVKCPSYCEPLIWLKNKQTDARFLITGIESSPYDGENVEVQCGLHCVSGLFDTYTYLDGSPCGMEVKE